MAGKVKSSRANAGTQRERQCRKVARERKTRNWMRAWMVRLRWCAVVLAIILITGVSIFLWQQGGPVAIATRTIDNVLMSTGNLGFTVNTITLEGRKRTDMADVKDALDVKTGFPILALSLHEIQLRLEKLPSVKSAAVERALPGTLHIQLTEREPVARWQVDQKLYLIDDEGAAMPDLDVADHPNLLLVVGAGAPKHIKEMLDVLAAAPALKPYVYAAVRIGDRRWNLRLKQGIEVRLPEDGAVDAWKQLAAMDEQEQVLARAVDTIDLRDHDRMFIDVKIVEKPQADNRKPPQET